MVWKVHGQVASFIARMTYIDTHMLMCNWASIFPLAYMFCTPAWNQNTWRRPTETPNKHLNPTQREPGWDSNPKPSCTPWHCDRPWEPCCAKCMFSACQENKTGIAKEKDNNHRDGSQRVTSKSDKKIVKTGKIDEKQTSLPCKTA